MIPSSRLGGGGVDSHTLRLHIQKLPREETLSLCFKLNQLQTHGWTHKIENYQAKTLRLLSIQNWIEPQDYVRLGTDVSKGNLFFARQNCLELARWLSVWGSSAYPSASNDIKRQRAFARALLSAFEIWNNRVQHPILSSSKFETGSSEAQQFEALRCFRENSLWAVSQSNPIRQLGRSNELFLEIFFGKNAEFQKCVEAKFGIEVTDYVTCIVGLASVWESWFNTADKGILDHFEFSPESLTATVPHMKEVFARFLQMESQTADELGKFYRDRDVQSITELKPLRERPIFSYSAGRRATFVDFSLFAERASNGLLFTTMKIPDGRAMEKFGLAFEEYVSRRLCEYVKMLQYNGVKVRGFPDVRATVPGRKEEPQFADYAMVDDDTLVLIETKASLLRDGIVTNLSSEEYWAEICEKYVLNTTERRDKRKGVSQLADSISKFIDGRLHPVIELFRPVKTIVPVLFVFDRHMTTLFHAKFLALEFRKKFPQIEQKLGESITIGDFRVLDLCLITIDEFEQFENQVLSTSLNNLLIRYSSQNPHREVAAGTYLSALSSEPFAPMRPIARLTTETMNQASLRLFGKPII